MRALLPPAVWCLVALLSGAALAQHGPNPLPWGIDDDVPIPARDASAPPETMRPPSPVSRLRLSRFLYSPGAFSELCPPRDDVVALVVRHLGYDPFGEPAAQIVLLSIEGDTAAAQARVDVLSVDGAPVGSRVVDSSEGCAELVATAALQLAIALDPLARPHADPDDVPEPPPPPADAAVPPSTPPPAPTEPATPPPSVPTGPLLDAQLFLAGSMHVAALLAPEGAMLGGAVGVGGRWSAVSVRVEGRFDLSGDERGTTSFPILASLVPCTHLQLIDLESEGPLELTGCLTATAGVMPAIGAYQGFGVYAGSGGRVSLDWRFDDEFALRLFGQLEAAALRPTFEAPTSGNVYVSPGFNLLGGVGMDLPNLW